MTIYIGLDVHKKGSVYCCQDESGNVIRAGQLPHNLEAIRELIGSGGKATRVALEATGSWQHVAAMLEAEGAEVVLSHPRRTRAIASAKVKTDAIDARTLADLLRVGLLPQAYLAPPATQELRRLVRTRASMVESRTRFKNQVHGVLTQAGLYTLWRTPSGELAGRGWQDWSCLPGQSGRGHSACGDRPNLGDGEASGEGVAEATGVVQRVPSLEHHSRVWPGHQRGLSGRDGDVWRFKRARHLLSYLGIVPRVHSSGGKTRFGRLTKEGPPLARNVLVQAAYPAIRKSPELRELYDKTKQRHGSQVARIAVARKLATKAFHTLRAVSSLTTAGSS